MKEKLQGLLDSVSNKYYPLLTIGVGSLTEILSQGEMGLAGRLTVPIPGAIIVYLGSWVEKNHEFASKKTAEFCGGFLVGSTLTHILMQYIQ